MTKRNDTERALEAAALRQDRERVFATQEAAAAFFKVKVARYRHWENGIRPVPAEFAAMFADKFGTDPRRYSKNVIVFGGGGLQEHEVLGEIAVGVWRDSSLDEQQRGKTVTGVASTGNRRWAFHVKDQSLNKLFRKGWFALVEAPPSKNLADYKDGQFLLIERHRGGLVEETVRRVEVSGSKYTLACHSTEKKFLGEVVTIPSKERGEEVTISGIVVGGTFLL